jgi:chromosome partitioning protein
MSRIIAIANQKGGCGKTTTAMNLSACLGLRGEKVLLADLDPQSHATVGLAGPTAPDGPGIAELIAGWAGPQEARRTVTEGLDLLSSSWRLADLEIRLTREGAEPTFLLEALRKLPGKYSLTVLDCPPGTGLLTRAALAAADLVVVPMETSYFALYGVGRMLALIEQEESNRRQALPYRILLTLFDRRTNLARRILKQAQEHFSSHLLNTVIAGNVSLREAAACSQPISTYRRRSRGFRDHMELSAEILATLSTAKEMPLAAAGGREWKT